MLNMWGTDVALVDTDEFCQHCERDAPLHYDRCVTRLIGQRVRVHLNLHRLDWSISDPKRGNVLASATDVTLEGVTFKVSEPTRQRINNTGRRRVHAWAVGTLVAVDTAPDTEGCTGITYNPYRAPTFTTFDGEPIHTAERVAFKPDRFGYLT